MQLEIGNFEHKAQRKKILDLLNKKDFVPTAVLRQFAYQYNARIFELREKGYIIKAEKIDNRHGFRLLGGFPNGIREFN